MLYREPSRLQVVRLWLRVLLAGRRRRATQDLRTLSPYLQRDLGFFD
jgi:hypothetical protein